jgi:hypothetical protein
MMTRAEKLLASRLLEMAAATFHEHGCNNTPAEVFEGLSAGEVGGLVRGFNVWFNEKLPGFNAGVDLSQIGDDEWMEYLAYRIGEG